jgi:hypothetical protein
MKSSQKKFGAIALFSFTLMGLCVESFAQSGSGSSNGNGNRNLIAYEKELKDTDLELRSLEESFQILIQSLRQLSEEQNIPLNGTSPDFWTKLPESDQKVLLNYDQELIGYIDAAALETKATLELIQTGLKTLSEMGAQTSHFKARGYQKKLREALRQRRHGLKFQVYQKFADTAYLLLAVNPKSNEPTNISSKFGIFLNSCNSPMCVDILLTKLSKYVDSLNEVFDTKLNVFNKERCVGRLATKGQFYYYPATFPKRAARLFLKGSTRDAFDRIYLLTLENVKQNNP